MDEELLDRREEADEGYAFHDGKPWKDKTEGDGEIDREARSLVGQGVEDGERSEFGRGDDEGGEADDDDRRDERKGRGEGPESPLEQDEAGQGGEEREVGDGIELLAQGAHPAMPAREIAVEGVARAAERVERDKQGRSGKRPDKEGREEDPQDA